MRTRLVILFGLVFAWILAVGLFSSDSFSAHEPFYGHDTELDFVCTSPEGSFDHYNAFHWNTVVLSLESGPACPSFSKRPVLGGPPSEWTNTSETATFVFSVVSFIVSERVYCVRGW